MTQLELPAVVRGRLREALEWVIENECEGVRPITIENDYKVRIDWLLREFGDCPLNDVCGARGYERMLAIAKREKAKPDNQRLKNITIKRRFKFMVRGLKKAAAREIIKKDQIPDVPKMRNDEAPQTDYFTLNEYERVRHALPSDWHRWSVDVGYWTGMHRKDVQEALKSHFDLNRPVLDPNGKTVGRGMYFFQNTKTRLHRAAWLPMDEGFKACVREYFEAHPEIANDDLAVGLFWKPRQWLYPACKRAKVKCLPYKQLRQSRFKYIEDQGVSFSDARYIMGHIGVSSRVTAVNYLGTVPGAGTVVRIHDQLNGSRKPPKPEVPKDKDARDIPEVPPKKSS